MKNAEKLRKIKEAEKKVRDKEFRLSIRKALGLENLKIKPREGALVIDLSDF